MAARLLLLVLLALVGVLVKRGKARGQALAGLVVYIVTDTWDVIWLMTHEKG